MVAGIIVSLFVCIVLFKNFLPLFFFAFVVNYNHYWSKNKDQELVAILFFYREESEGARLEK